MKKILTLILVLLLALTFMVSCDKLAEIPGLGQIFGDEGNNGGENETPEVDADLQLAYDYVHQMTKTIAEVTGANYTVAGEVKIGDKSYTVKWEVSDSKVSLETSEDGLTVTVVVPSRTYEDIPYTLKFTVTNEKGETLSREYKHLVPEFKVSSFEEYMAAKEGDNLVVKGIVVAINSKAAGNTRNHLFLADEDVVGGYYSYQMEADPVADLGIEVGMTVLVTGPAAPYSGMMEIKGGVAEVVSTEKKTVDFVDVTADFAAGDNLGKYTALPVVIKGVTIGTQELGGTSEYLKFSLNGHTSYIRTYVTDFPTTLKSADKATIDAAHAAHFGWTADVYGIVVLYSGNPYLIPLSVDCFTNYVEVEMTDAEKIANSVENVVIIDAVKEDMVIELPIVGKYYDDVTITWTVDSTDYNIDENGKLTVKLGEAEVTLTLTATFKCGDATETKTYTVVVDAASDQEYITKPTADVAAGIAYKFGLVQGTLGKTLYLTGEVSGRYLVTTEYVKDAADVFVEAVDGGYKFYIVVDGANKYIEVYNNADSKLSVQFSDNASVFAYNATVNAWVTNMDGTDYYIGTYNNFNTVSASKLSYITAENTGVSQFPGNFFKYEFVSETPACQHANTETETVDPTCTKEGTTTVTCADCGKVVSTVKIASTGHSYADGVCSACGATQPAAGSVTVSKNISDLIVSEGWDNTTTKQEFALDSNVTVKVDGGSNSGKAYSDHIRVYATDTPAGSITISVCTGYELVSVKVTTVEGTYAFLTLGAGTDDISNQTVSVSGSSVVLNTIKNGSDGKQVRVLAIEVVYQAA